VNEPLVLGRQRGDEIGRGAVGAQAEGAEELVQVGVRIEVMLDEEGGGGMGLLRVVEVGEHECA